MPVKGCYEVRSGPWDPELGEVLFSSPFRARLYSDGTVRRLPVEEVWLELSDLGRWTHLKESAIGLYFTDGYSGISMELKVLPDRLVGEAEDFWDFQLTHQTVSAVLTRIDCDNIIYTPLD
ncbi:hypothetical protein ACFL3I_06300 [Pseudomonadota bacterium]